MEGTTEITVSVLSYLKTQIKPTGVAAEMVNLAKAMYLYNQAANAYYGK